MHERRARSALEQLIRPLGNGAPPLAERVTGGVAPTYLSARAVSAFSRCAMLSSRCCAAAALALASALAVLASAASSNGAEPTTPATGGTTSAAAVGGGSNCTRCGATTQSRAMQLQAIKAQILSKLGMKRAPNVTRRALPGIPPLHRLLDRYDAGMMQADAPFEPGEQYDEDDDFHVAAEKIITFGQPGERLVYCRVHTGRPLAPPSLFVSKCPSTRTAAKQRLRDGDLSCYCALLWS